MLIASTSYDHTALLWRCSDGECLMELSHAKFASSVAWSPDGRRVATSSGDRSVRVWGVRGADGANTDGTLQLLLHGHTSWVRRLF